MPSNTGLGFFYINNMALIKVEGQAGGREKEAITNNSCENQWLAQCSLPGWIANKAQFPKVPIYLSLSFSLSPVVKNLRQSGK